ncbi:MAG: hypothetical protein RR564_06035, partial [Eubacterium sp.]
MKQLYLQNVDKVTFQVRLFGLQIFLVPHAYSMAVTTANINIPKTTKYVDILSLSFKFIAFY